MSYSLRELARFALISKSAFEEERPLKGMRYSEKLRHRITETNLQKMKNKKSTPDQPTS